MGGGGDMSILLEFLHEIFSQNGGRENARGEKSCKQISMRATYWRYIDSDTLNVFVDSSC